MVGEFDDGEGNDYVMIVNLSLQYSANIALDTVKSYKTMEYFSTEDGKWLPLHQSPGHWLLAGHGILIRLK